MHRTPTPFRTLLAPDQQDVLDQIRARSIARFGFDAFRMEGDGGDSGDGGDGGDGDGGSGDGDGADGASDDGATKSKASDKGSEAGKVGDLPQWAQDLIKNTRGEAAENRTKATAAEKKQADTLDSIAKALGLKKDEQVDPAELAKQLDQQKDAARTAAVELAVYKTASKHQGDPDALLDSRAFLAKVSDLDPSASDFAKKVDAAIKDAVDSNSKLKATQAAGSSSADHGAGGSGEKKTRTPKSLADAVGGHYGT